MIPDVHAVIDRAVAAAAATPSHHHSVQERSDNISVLTLVTTAAADLVVMESSGIWREGGEGTLQIIQGKLAC